MHSHTPFFRPGPRALLLIVLAVGAAGCNSRPSTVTGRVTYRGVPVTSGSIALFCEGQQIVRGLIGPDGRYTIPNVPPGPVRVTVAARPRLPEGFKKKYLTPPVINGPITPEPGRPAKDPRTPDIPGRYAVPEESGLTLTVDRNVTEFDIDLTP